MIGEPTTYRGRVRHHRALALLTGVLAVLTLTVSCESSPDGSAPLEATIDASGGVPVPDGAYFGAHVTAEGPDRRTSLLALEDAVGRRFAIEHVYYRWDSTFPSAYDRATSRQGRLLFLNWTTRLDAGGAVDWADIADGRYDALIDRRAQALSDFGAPVLLGFAHEPGALLGEGAERSGDESAYIDAWRHIVDRFAALGVDNVSWVWTLTAYAFRTGDPGSLYPGDDIVDWVGVDGYVNLACPWLDVPWSSWTETFTPAAQFAAGHHKPLVVAEFGLREDPADPQRKGQWLADAADEIRQMPQIKAVVSFDSQESCSSPVDSSPEALEGYREMGAAPWLSDLLPARRQ
jgi:hypothetical protein